MNPTCLICNTRTGPSSRNATNLFGDDLQLNSGKPLCAVIGDIVEKKIKEEGVYTHVICKKCQKAVVEYDSLQVRLQAIKDELIDQFKKTLQKQNLTYDTFNKEITINTPVKKNEAKKLVLPASKLQPLPPDFLIKSGIWPMSKSVAIPMTKPVMTIPSSSTLKVTVGSSVLTQSVNTNTITNKRMIPQTVNPKLIMTSKIEKINPSKSDEILTSSNQISTSLTFTQPISTNTSASSKSAPIFSFNVNSLPKDFLSSAILTKLDGDFDVEKLKKTVSIEDNDLEHRDEQAMEIDEDCSLTVLSTGESETKLIYEDDIKEEAVEGESKKESFLDVRMLNAQGQYVVGKLQLLRAGEGEGEERTGERAEHTIVMEGENGSILRVVSGQKLLYGDNELSLVLPELQDAADEQDSNDSSQIELQVSGDEETAHAIIAAAREQGGAFIKVESGEMYRVQSVQSKTEAAPATAPVDNSIVVHVDGQFRCLLCEKNAPEDSKVMVGDAEQTMQHVRSAHSARVYICRHCACVLRRRADYLAHVEQHGQKSNTLTNTDKSKVHECNVCKKKYSSRTLLKEHMNVHNGTRPHVCNVCGKTFASKYTHQSHLKTHLVRPRPFKCAQCGKSFLTAQNLSQHEKTHSGVKDFICTVCGKAFGTQHNLDVHGVVHSGNKPFVCGACGKAFARRAEVRDHMRIHTGERPFSCDICGASFTQRSNLHSHKRATHLDDKRYHCTQCPKRFKRRRLLDYHVKASHTGERPLKCEICRATFVYPEHYKKHARIHSGEKPYTCEVCGKSFNSRDNRNTHRFVHSDRKPYECVVCGAGYMRKQLLYQHMNTSGHLAESIVVNQPRVTKIADNVAPTQSVAVETEKTNKLPETIYEATTEELQMGTGDKSIVATDESGAKFIITGDKKILLQDGKSINIVQEGEESALITLHNIEGDLKDGTILDSVSAEQLADQQGQLRLVSVSLPDGSNGWVAINH